MMVGDYQEQQRKQRIMLVSRLFTMQARRTRVDSISIRLFQDVLPDEKM